MVKMRKKVRGKRLTSQKSCLKIDTIEAARVYNSAEVAQMLQCCPVTVRNMIKEGFIKGKKTGQGFKVLGSAITDYLTG